MNTWYYRQADHDVGPFERDVLEKLKRAGVIDDSTLIKNSSLQDWRAFGEVRAEEVRQRVVLDEEARYFYLDAKRQPVGPMDIPGLRLLLNEGVITSETLTSTYGENCWIPLRNRLREPERVIPEDDKDQMLEGNRSGDPGDLRLPDWSGFRRQSGPVMRAAMDNLGSLATCAIMAVIAAFVVSWGENPILEFMLIIGSVVNGIRFLAAISKAERRR